MKKTASFLKDTGGDAVVEATILFPIIIMVFAGLVMLAAYLPARATLQRATQYAATALAVERSDTWLAYDEGRMAYSWKEDKSELDNVYVALLKSLFSSGGADKAEDIVTKVEENGISVTAGSLTVEYDIVNYIIYKEIVVTATRVIPVPVDLTFISFPKEIPITVTSAAVVQNGDEFIRNMDIAVDFVEYVDQKFNLSSSGIFVKVKELSGRFTSFLGI